MKKWNAGYPTGAAGQGSSSDCNDGRANRFVSTGGQKNKLH
jgi:hypothetical protein